MASQELIYPINEIFQSIQGEGYFTGQPAIFIRLQGCDVGCSWCDTRHTWIVDPDHEVSSQQILDHSSESACWAGMTTEQLCYALHELGYTARHVVLTGGEPCQYDLRPLSRALIELGYKVQIETSGTAEIRADSSCWVTLSPKIGMKGGYTILDGALVRAQEIKHPVAMEKHIHELDHLLARCQRGEEKIICLQPISQQRRATELAIRVCIERNWRLSVQMHKYLNVD
jgi:7-carboxy-7-deazaguanine synthase